MSTTTPVAPATRNGRKLDQQAFLSILSARKPVKTSDVGSQILFTIQGNGQMLPAGFQYAGATGITENQRDRMIYNLAANDTLKMLRKENKQLLTEAMQAESAGDVDKAHDLYNEYLNTVQISFSLLLPSSRSFSSGAGVTAWIAEYVHPTTGARSLVANDVRLVPPKHIDSVKYDIADLIEA